MAISATVVWEVRTTGSDLNGGGYKPGSTGTDWSQQDAAQYSVTDAVTNGTSTVTSATANFGVDVVGNVVYINAIRYEILTRVNATTITVDTTIGAAAGLTLRIGGALASPGMAAGSLVSGNDGYIKAGTYVVSVNSNNVSNGKIVSQTGLTDANTTRWEGYQTVRGDKGTRPIIQLQAALGASINIFQLSRQNFVDNVEVDGNSNTGSQGFVAGAANAPPVAIRCKASRCATGFTFNTGLGNGFCILCEATLCSSAGFSGTIGCHGCYAHDNTATGFAVGGTDCIDCISANNTGASSDGFSPVGGSGSGLIINCIAYGNGRTGYRWNTAGQVTFINCIAVLNAGWGWDSIAGGSASELARAVNCAQYNNTLGVATGGMLTEGMVALTGSPFTNPAGGDYSLNSVTGQGLACRAGGLPHLYPGSASTSFVDVGAVQTQGAPVPASGQSGQRTWWREWTNEKNITAVPDSVVDIYLGDGHEALNRKIGYYFVDGTLTLVAGQQEYSCPADFVGMVWAYHNGAELKKSDVETWTDKFDNWRQDQGKPEEFAVYGNKVILRKIPTAKAVQEAGTVPIRYVAQPPDYTQNGPLGLLNQDLRIPVYWGVRLWAMAHPDSALAVHRLSRFEKMFEEESDKIEGQYAARKLSRS